MANGKITAPCPTIADLAGAQDPDSNLQPLLVDADGNLLVSVSGSIVATNPSVGLNGAAIPLDSTLIGGSDGTNLRPIHVTSAGDLAALPLPNGAGTAAKQDTGNTSLASIDTKTPALGQALAGASVPVVLTAAQITTLTPPTTVTVTGTVAATQSGIWNITNVSGTVSLPTGAATESTLSTLNGKVTACNTGAVVLAAGTALVGKAGIDQTTPGTTNAVAIAQIGANTVLTGNGTTGTGSQRVTIASDNTAFSVNTLAKTPTAGTITQAAVTVGTSAVRCTVSGSAPSATRVLLVVTPDPASGAKFYIGSSSVTSSSTGKGIPVQPGQPVTFNSDSGDYYIISDTASQTFFVMEQ